MNAGPSPQTQFVNIRYTSFVSMFIMKIGLWFSFSSSLEFRVLLASEKEFRKPLFFYFTKLCE